MPVLATARRFGSLGSAVLALLAGISLLPVAVASASAEELLVVTCPQTTSAVGFPITERPFVDVPTAPGSVAITITGALPAGLVVTTDPQRPQLSGTPTRVQATSFTVNAKITDADGTSRNASRVCTMDVKAGPTVTRIAGVDRYDQSVKVSKATFPTTVPVVYLASGEKFPDALSASAVAAEHLAPLLLTAGGAAPAGVLNEIARLMPSDIVIVGGVNAVSLAVADQVKAIRPSATITRIGGADRYVVSRNLIADEKFGIETSTAVYIATGTNFPDALSASPAAATADAPVLLVNGSETALTTDEKALLTGLGAKNAFIVGGTVPVSVALQHDLEKSFTTVRYGGGDRFAVSAAVNAGSFTESDIVYLASATAFPDALGGGVAAGIAEAPLYITQQNCLVGEAARAIGRMAPKSVVILGGTAALGPALDGLKICP